MKSGYLDKAISLAYLEYDITASLQGTDVFAAGSTPGYTEYTLDDVSSNQFTTVFLVPYRVEDVGSIEVISIFLQLDFTLKGNGSIRWQISGDGGSNWVTCAQGDFNNPDFVEDFFLGSGVWISNIDPGNNKLQLRMQILANSGTINSTIFDYSILELTYRKKVLS